MEERCTRIGPGVTAKRLDASSDAIEQCRAHRTGEAFALSKVPEGTGRTVEISFVSTTVAFAFLALEWSSAGWARWLGLAGVSAGCVAYLLSILSWARLRGVNQPVLSFEQEDVRVRGRDGRSHLAVPYHRVLSLERYEWPHPGWALYVAGRTPIAIPDSTLGSPADAEVLLSELTRRVAALPDGAERLRAMAERADLGARQSGRWPWFAIGVAGVLVFVFVLQVFTEAISGERVVTLGASSTELLFSGDWTRLITPAFLHVSLLHLGANALTIVLVGYCLEGFVGHVRTALLFAIPSAAGILAASLANPGHTSLGASAGAMGMVGALLLMNAHRRDEIPSRLRIPPLVLASTVGIVLVGEFWWWGVVSHLGHLGGLLAGGLLYWLMVRGRRFQEVQQGATTAEVVLLCSAAAAYSIGFWRVLVAAHALGPAVS